MSSRIAIASALNAALLLVGTCGFAADAPPVHRSPWPIYDWRDPNQSQEVVDRLYDQLLSSSNKILKDEPALVH
jgi:hypothetical protein